MRALILSCNTGGGHNSAGMAMKERIEAEGGEACFFDYLTLAGGKVSKAVEDGYVKLVKTTPLVFGLVYKLGAIISKMTKRSPVYYVNGMMAKYLKKFLERNDFDVIIMPHLYPAETITYMRRRGMELPLTVAIGTDYTCIPFWEETECDYYMIPHEELLEEFAKGKIQKQQLFPSGIPVSLEYNRELGKVQARKEMSNLLSKEFGADDRIFLIIGGSMGAGRLKNLTKLLFFLRKRADRLIVICGSNERMCRKLEHIFRKQEIVTVVGKTDCMPLFMKAADVVYTKPGGLTSTEAAITGVPLVMTSPIPGCETVNRRFFRKHGMCVSGRNIYAQAVAGIRILNNSEIVEKMIHNQHTVIAQDASYRIYRFIEDKLRERQM